MNSTSSGCSPRSLLMVADEVKDVVRLCGLSDPLTPTRLSETARNELTVTFLPLTSLTDHIGNVHAHRFGQLKRPTPVDHTCSLHVNPTVSI